MTPLFTVQSQFSARPQISSLDAASGHTQGYTSIRVVLGEERLKIDSKLRTSVA